MSKRFNQKSLLVCALAGVTVACGVAATPAIWRADLAITLETNIPVVTRSINGALFQAYKTGGHAELRKVSAAGTQEWRKTLPAQESVNHLSALSGGVIVAGATDGWSARYDNAGNLMWSLAVAPAGATTYDASDVINDRLVVSYASSDETAVVALGTNGAELWRYSLDRSGENDVVIEKVILLAGGNTIALAHKGAEVTVIAIDASGNLLSQHTLTGTDIDVLSAYASGNNAYVIFDNALQRLNNDGSVIWKKTIGVNSYCSSPSSDEIACFKRDPAGTAMQWFQVNGGLRLAKTLPISDATDLTYVGNQQWVINSHAESAAAGSTPASVYWKLHVVNANGDAPRTITLAPSNVSTLWPDYTYTSNGDGLPRLVSDGATVYVSGSTTLNHNAYLSAYSLK